MSEPNGNISTARFTPRQRLIGIGIFLAINAAYLVGYGSGYSDQKPEPAATVDQAPAAMSVAAPALPCASEEFVRARNNAWAIMNSLTNDNFNQELVKDNIDAISTLFALAMGPDTPAKIRAEMLDLYPKKGLFLFKEAEREKLFQNLLEGTPEERLRWFGYLNTADLKATQFLQCLLADDARIKQYLAGEEIALEGE